MMTSTNNVMTRDGTVCALTTNASDEGWGAVYETKTTGGLWSSDEKRHHINYLELLAIFLGLKAFCSAPSHMHISLKMDNINHTGMSHSEQ